GADPTGTPRARSRWHRPWSGTGGGCYRDRVPETGWPPSSSGLGRLPFTQVTRVRIAVGVLHLGPRSLPVAGGSWGPRSPQRIPPRSVGGHPGGEVGPSLVVRRRPGHLGEGRDAGQGHLLHLRQVGDQLGPQRCLDAEDLGGV